ncbi:hypothetical protein J2T57_001606 [Natronocella acetinitrilica]|uniref:Uncharacterized protein n=1 Tax=Natronocella acetinitrilica TaxID=414046 RepID=A0AAE3G3P8_9GAMM|nr:hypothetical protein [Natronocella acetinitrilica]MCP1674504.1 hypothetical protein [Natronocella acetinitrilica]
MATLAHLVIEDAQRAAFVLHVGQEGESLRYRLGLHPEWSDCPLEALAAAAREALPRRSGSPLGAALRAALEQAGYRVTAAIPGAGTELLDF